jgi:hypothetical protein
MCPETSAPAFEDFLRFVASRCGPSRRASHPPDRVLAAARAAHDELRAPSPLAPRRVEVLELLAASSGDMARPAELVTGRGFRVRLDYRDGTETEPSSICVLVQCPQPLVASVQGQVAYLWNGAERFELGEFDPDGKAIGTLPAGIEITLADFAAGRVKLDTPDVQEPTEPRG